MNFHRFHDTWSDQLRQLVRQLSTQPPLTSDDERQLRVLVQRSISHHAEYYRAKSAAAEHDVLAFFSAAASPWTTALERSLHWVGGWRPTTAFHLVYTECSILFEPRVAEILRGIETGGLGDLSPAQFRRVSELQTETAQLENDISEDLADWQDDSSNLVGKVYVDNSGRMKRLAEILASADQLRLRTIESLVELMTTLQAAQFLVAAAELHFAVRGWGIQQDRRRENK